MRFSGAVQSQLSAELGDRPLAIFSNLSNLWITEPFATYYIDSHPVLSRVQVSRHNVSWLQGEKHTFASRIKVMEKLGGVYSWQSWYGLVTLSFR